LRGVPTPEIVRSQAISVGDSGGANDEHFELILSCLDGSY